MEDVLHMLRVRNTSFMNISTASFLSNYHLKYNLNQFVVLRVTNSMYGFKLLNLRKLRMIQVVIEFAFSDP